MRWHRRLVRPSSDLGVWTAWLFIVGATLFAAGSFPAYAQLVDPGVVGATFFVGSLFFTSAAFGQFLLVINDARADDAAFRSFELWARQTTSLVWWAAVVQLAGTVAFNVSTFTAMADGFSTTQTNVLVWAPDAAGSIAFLVASQLGWLAVCGRLWCIRRDDVDWWMAALNYAGSIFFGLAAIGALTLPTTGDELNITLVNVGTFIGAICFLVGAYLLMPEAARQQASHGVAPRAERRVLGSVVPTFTWVNAPRLLDGSPDRVRPCPAAIDRSEPRRTKAATGTSQRRRSPWVERSS